MLYKKLLCSKGTEIENHYLYKTYIEHLREILGVQLWVLFYK